MDLATDLKYNLIPTSSLCDLGPQELLQGLGAPTFEALVQNPSHYHRQALRYLFLSVGGSGDQKLVDLSLGLLLRHNIEPCSYLQYLIQGAARRGHQELLARFPRVEPCKRVYWQVAGTPTHPGIDTSSRPFHMVFRGLIARGDRLSTLQDYLRSHSIRGREEWEQVLSEAAKRGRVSVLKWLFEDCGLLKYLKDESLGTHLAAQGAKGGSEEVVRYMETHLLFHGKRILSYALEGGNEKLVSRLLGSRLCGLYPDGIISFVGFRNYKVLINLLLEKGAKPTFFPRVLIEGDELATIKKIALLMTSDMYEQSLNRAATTAAELGRPRLLRFFLSELRAVEGTTNPFLLHRAVVGGHLDCLRLSLLPETTKEILEHALDLSYRYRHPHIRDFLLSEMKARGFRPSIPPLSLPDSHTEDLVPLLRLWNSRLPDNSQLLRFFLQSVFRRLNRCRALGFQSCSFLTDERREPEEQEQQGKEISLVGSRKPLSWASAFSPTELTLLNTLSEGYTPDFSHITGSVLITSSSNIERVPVPWSFSIGSSATDSSNRILSPSAILQSQITAFVSREPVPTFHTIGCRVVRPLG